MPVGFSAGGPRAGAVRRRPVVVEPPPTQVIRWIAPGGTGNGQSVSTPGDIANLNQYIGEVGPGGEVRIRADLGDYQLAPTLNLSNGGTAAARVTVRGCNAAGVSMKAQLRKGRTSPWPAAARGGSAGGTIFQLNSGANYINFKALHLRDCVMAMKCVGNITGMIWGDRAYRDTAVTNLLPQDYIFDKSDPGYLALIQQIYDASAAGVSSNIQVDAVDMTNCERGLDTGSSEGDPNSLFDFECYGGTFTGTGQGFFRIRGLGRNIWFQDCSEDGGGGPRNGPNQYLSSDGSNNWAVGWEIQARRSGGLALTPAYRTGTCFVGFLRCKANANRDSQATRGYTNGDGFSGESGNDGCLYIRCEATDNEDGGLETKALNTTVIGFKTYRNGRNMRLWGFADLFQVDSRDPQGGNGKAPVHIYTKSSKNWIRVFSGSCSGNTSNVFETASDGNVGWLAVDPAFQVTKPTSATLYQHGAPHGYCGSYNLTTTPVNAATPSFTSNGDRRVANNVRDIYTPTFSAPCTREMIDNDPTTDGYRDANGPNGLQSLFYDGNGWEVLMQSTTGETDTNKRDVNRDGVYEYDLVGRAANWKTVTQRVRVAVGNVQFPTGPVDPPPDPDPPPDNPITTILARMSTAGAAPNAARTTLYQNFINVFTANSSAIANKTVQMVWPKSHHANAAKLGWIGPDIEADGSRAFPGFIIDQGYKSTSNAQWAYWGGANNANFSSSSIAIAGLIETLPPEVGGVDTRADCFGWSGLNVAVYSSGIISVQVNGGSDIWIDPGPAPFYVYAERSGTTITTYTKNTLFSTKTSQPIGNLTTERPRMSSVSGGATGTATVAFAWMGSPLTAAERTAMYNGVNTLTTAIGLTVVDPDPPDPDPDPDPTVPVYPLVAILGASRFRQGYYSNDGVDYIETTAVGQFEWAKALGVNFRLVAYPDASIGSPPNINGMVFANDGEAFGQMRNRLPKLLATDADAVIVNAAVSSFDFGMTVDSYCNVYKDILTQIQAAGKYAIAEQVWERGTAVGAGHPWGPGQAPRNLTPAINAEMATWCAARGIPIIKCRDVLIDINNVYTTNKEPLPFTTRTDTSVSYPAQTGDGTHLSPYGAYIYGKEIRRALEAAWNPPPAVQAADAAGNKCGNPLMSGTGGTLTGITGQLADGYTAVKRGTALTIVAAKTSSAPINTRFGTATKQWQQFTITGASGLSGVREGIGNFRTTVTGMTIGKWYECRAKVEVAASASYSGISGRFTDGTGWDSRFMSVVDTGGGTGQGSWANNVLPYYPETFGAMFTSMPIKAGATTGTFAFDVGVKGGSNDAVVVRFADFECREVPDPALMMTQIANNDPVIFTSPAAFSVSEDDAIALTITVSEPCSFSISGGADAALFTIGSDGILRGGPFDYALPVDAGGNNIYNVTVTATPFASGKSAVSQAIAITVTEDVSTGGSFFDNFTGTNGTDLANYNSQWTRATGPSGALVINNNTVINVPGSARGTYLAPQQGDTRNQWVRWTMPTTSNKCEVVSLWQDDTNYLRISPQGSSGTYSLGKIINGVFSSTPGTLYKAWAASDVWDSIIDGDTYKLYQNNVLIGSMDITGLLTGARRVGLRSSTTSGAVNGIDNFEAKAYTGNYVAKIALNALTMTPLTGATTSQYVGNLSGRTAGSTISLSSVTPNNENWFADGDQIRRNAGGTAGTYTVVVREDHPNAVNSGRTTSFTVAIS